jgi:hypothetical protein
MSSSNENDAMGSPLNYVKKTTTMWWGSISEPRSHEDEIGVSEALDKLREEILRLERELGMFGYDPRRGVESYSISELKDLIERSGPNRSRVRELLVKLVTVQEELYMELYRLAGLKELNVDTETPEKNILRLKKWLLTGEAHTSPSNATRSRTKFEQAVETIVEILKTCQENCEDRVLDALKGIYKRDYDRYRVMKHVLEVCAEIGYAVDLSKLEPSSLRNVARLICKCSRSVGVSKLVAYLKLRG